MKLFVSDFAEETTAAQLAELFERFGAVTAVRLRTGQKRRYAVVEMPDRSEGLTAINELARRDWHGQPLDVKESWW